MHIVRSSILVAIAIFGFSLSSRAQDRGFGLGVVIGEPTGFSFKGWTSRSNAIDGGLAWSFSHETSFHVHVDYLWHDYDVFETNVRLPLYYGIGGRLKASEDGDARLGLRIPVGINLQLRDAPLDFFLEIAPIVDIAPDTDFEFNAGLGVRYFFQ